MLAKKQREDEDARKHLERNYQTAKVLREQMEVLEKQKEEEKRLRAENIKLIVSTKTKAFVIRLISLNAFKSKKESISIKWKRKWLTVKKCVNTLIEKKSSTKVLGNKLHL